MMGARRLQRYLTERMLSQSPALAPLCAVAVQYRERLDGSGYPRGLSGGAISRPARILGAADSYQSIREARPHRGALQTKKRPVSCATRCAQADLMPMPWTQCYEQQVVPYRAASRDQLASRLAK